MGDNISEAEVYEEFKETVVVWRTKAVIRQLLFVLLERTIANEHTVDDLRDALDELVSEPTEGVDFILRFDDLLRSELELRRGTITETFIEELNESIDFLTPEGEGNLPEQLARIRSDYSQLYGKNSAWN